MKCERRDGKSEVGNKDLNAHIPFPISISRHLNIKNLIWPKKLVIRLKHELSSVKYPPLLAHRLARYAVGKLGANVNEHLEEELSVERKS